MSGHFRNTGNSEIAILQNNKSITYGSVVSTAPTSTKPKSPPPEADPTPLPYDGSMPYFPPPAAHSAPTHCDFHVVFPGPIHFSASLNPPTKPARTDTTQSTNYFNAFLVGEDNIDDNGLDQDGEAAFTISSYSNKRIKGTFELTMIQNTTIKENGVIVSGQINQLKVTNGKFDVPLN